MLLRVGVHGFVAAAVHAQVGLPIAGQVLGQHRHRPGHGLLKNAGAQDIALPGNVLREGYINGY